MPISSDSAARNPSTPVLGALGAVGLALALIAFRRPHSAEARQGADRRRAFAAYLKDHLTGSDAAIHLVERLREAHRGRAEEALFASLSEQFSRERSVVEALLAALGASAVSVKRLAGHATGAALRLAPVGEPGDLSLFRSLEMLATAVQGKRCLWRAAQALPSLRREHEARTFEQLEADALSQWEAIDRYRLSTVPLTFAV